MKKFIVFVFASLVILGLASCSGCGDSKNTKPLKSGKLVVENLISTDREGMFLNYSTDYRWYETQITMKNFLDEETDGEIASVVNVFQIVADRDGSSFDTKVVMFSHTKDSTEVEVKDGFWIEDFALNDEAIVITFEEAFQKVMEVNLPKPHSRHCVLREQIGPKPCNPQYIFGNTRAQIYVDATTGEVSDVNPAFGEGFGMPLGEWP